MRHFATGSLLVASAVALGPAAGGIARAQELTRPRASLAATNLQQFGQTGTAPSTTPGGPESLTLQAAIALARAGSQQLRSAVTAADLATEDRVQARAALLPFLSGFGQYVRTQPNGTGSGVFVANDGPNV